MQYLIHALVSVRLMLSSIRVFRPNCITSYMTRIQIHCRSGCYGTIYFMRRCNSFQCVHYHRGLCGSKTAIPRHYPIWTMPTTKLEDRFIYRIIVETRNLCVSLCERWYILHRWFRYKHEWITRKRKKVLPQVLACKCEGGNIAKNSINMATYKFSGKVTIYSCP